MHGAVVSPPLPLIKPGHDLHYVHDGANTCPEVLWLHQHHPGSPTSPSGFTRAAGSKMEKVPEQI